MQYFLGPPGPGCPVGAARRGGGTAREPFPAVAHGVFEAIPCAVRVARFPIAPGIRLDLVPAAAVVSLVAAQTGSVTVGGCIFVIRAAGIGIMRLPVGSIVGFIVVGKIPPVSSVH